MRDLWGDADNRVENTEPAKTQDDIDDEMPEMVDSSGSEAGENEHTAEIDSSDDIEARGISWSTGNRPTLEIIMQCPYDFEETGNYG